MLSIRSKIHRTFVIKVSYDSKNIPILTEFPISQNVLHELQFLYPTYFETFMYQNKSLVFNTEGSTACGIRTVQRLCSLP